MLWCRKHARRRRWRSCGTLDPGSNGGHSREAFQPTPNLLFLLQKAGYHLLQSYGVCCVCVCIWLRLIERQHLQTKLINAFCAIINMLWSRKHCHIQLLRQPLFLWAFWASIASYLLALLPADTKNAPGFPSHESAHQIQAWGKTWRESSWSIQKSNRWLVAAGPDYNQPGSLLYAWKSRRYFFHLRTNLITWSNQWNVAFDCFYYFLLLLWIANCFNFTIWPKKGDRDEGGLTNAKCCSLTHQQNVDLFFIFLNTLPEPDFQLSRK